MPGSDLLSLRVRSVTFEADGVLSFDLRSPEGAALPPFEAGAHVDLHLPGGLVRSYSLVNAQDERHRYVIAVHRDPASRGGSRFMHQGLRAGETIQVAPPRNNFRLAEDAARSVLIAGGIGITPLWCMIQRLETLGREWELFYATRTRSRAALLDVLGAVARPERVHLTFDHEPGGKMLDLAAIVAAQPDGTHLYCCGPNPMLAAFEEATASLPRDRVHVEYFSAREAAAVEGGFTVVLARSGRSIQVPPGKTILEALLEHQVNVPYSCTEGVCGTCEVGVLEGIPDHRDLVLSDEERAAGKTMMICCSGSRTPRLVLDW